MINVEDFEAQQWEREGWQAEAAAYLAKLKGQIPGLIERRLSAYRLAEELADAIEQAHERIDYGKQMSGPKLAEWLNKNHLPAHQQISKARINALRNVTMARLVEEAVRECRTLMTARALSADFNRAEVGSLESEYIEIIANILNLGRRLRNEVPVTREWLLKEARREAIDVAKEQRKTKPVSMAARGRYWRDKEPPIRKVFQP